MQKNVNNQYTLQGLNNVHKKHSKEAIIKMADGMFCEFKDRNAFIQKCIIEKRSFFAALGILNSFDHYAQFYKGVVPNRKSHEDQVKCFLSKQNCAICWNSISYKCRTGGNRSMQIHKWHYSNNGKWEMATVGEGYKNFLKNTGIRDKKSRDEIYKLRNIIDHQGFWDDQIEINGEKLLLDGEDLFKLLKDSLKEFEKHLKDELAKKNFRVDKSSRVLRFLDHLYFVTNSSPPKRKKKSSPPSVA